MEAEQLAVKPAKKKPETIPTAKQREASTILRVSDTTTPLRECAIDKLRCMKLQRECDLAESNPKAAAKALRSQKSNDMQTLADQLEGKSRKRRGLQGQ